MDSKLRRLFHEVQRQLQIPLEVLEQDFKSANSGIFMPQQMYQNYRTELEQLHECLSEFQDVCELMGEDVYTEDIWENTQLHEWARSDQSSLLMIQGGYESVNRLERFAAEVWEHLDSKKPTVAMLQCLSSTDFFSGFDERELLRQIALQALRKASPGHPICFLADMVHLFAEASTCEDWFRILERIFEMFPSLIVILTVTVLGEQAESTVTWPIQFEKMMTRIQKRSLTCSKVLLIATHQLWVAPETPSLFWVGPAPETDSDDGMGGTYTPSEHQLPLSFPIQNRSAQEIFQISEASQGDTVWDQPGQHNSIHKELKAGRPESLQQSSSSSHPTQIDIAVLCALTLEADAVETLFDGQWTGGYRRSNGDTNTYTLGIIGCHGVVLVHMPACQRARKLPVEILGYLAKLKGLGARKRLRELATGYLATLSKVLEVTNPGPDEDVLFESTYSHKHHPPSLCNVCIDNSGETTGMICGQARAASCKDLNCDTARSVPRKRQREAAGNQRRLYPAVHFGKFGSGDKVMKSGQDRDRIASSEGIIAFEMEGAGAWDTLPCVIIKGICDYSDSHKDKRWQAYAASTAAAYAKAFMEGWRK
ncbi:putative pfs domain-containing protein [Fusarium bulbicola]|nr:putative pfs domain-containing protein [Fusarium bulbicola]